MTTATHETIARTHRIIATGFLGHRVEVQTDDASHTGLMVAVVGFSLVLATSADESIVLDLGDVNLIARVDR